MSDKTGAPENMPDAPPPPDPNWEEPKTDSRIALRFLGDSPFITEMRFMQCTPGHLWAAAERLRYEASKAQMIQDQADAQMGIQTTGKMPGKIERP